MTSPSPTGVRDLWTDGRTALQLIGDDVYIIDGHEGQWAYGPVEKGVRHLVAQLDAATADVVSLTEENAKFRALGCNGAKVDNFDAAMAENAKLRAERDRLQRELQDERTRANDLSGWLTQATREIDALADSIVVWATNEARVVTREDVLASLRQRLQAEAKASAAPTGGAAPVKEGG